MSSDDFKAEKVDSSMKWQAAAKVDSKGNITELAIQDGATAIAKSYSTYETYKAATDTDKMIGVEITQTDLATWTKSTAGSP